MLHTCDMVQYGPSHEFFDPGPICSDSVQVESNPIRTVQRDLEL